MARVPLRSVALARSGDKGAHANVGLWVHDAAIYELLRTAVTAHRVAAHFAALEPSSVERFELPNILGFNFLLHDVLGRGGAAGSLRTDAQAKTYSQAMLLLEIDVPDDLARRLGAAPPGP